MSAVSLTDLDVTIQVFTAQSAQILAAAGITAPVEIHEHRSADEIRALQRNADVLFLPLAFSSPYPRLIRSSSPAKLGEYLASGRPVLVHAPRDTFVAEYFREHRCGVVVDEPDPVVLAAAVRQLLEDDELRANVTNAAWARANADYDLDTARASFAAALGFGNRPAASSVASEDAS
jgi:glycosyltransferase involved in cell wall biosynthesis